MAKGMEMPGREARTSCREANAECRRASLAGEGTKATPYLKEDQRLQSASRSLIVDERTRELVSDKNFVDSPRTRC